MRKSASCTASLIMPLRPKRPQKRLNFDNPESFPLEVRTHATELNNLQRIIDYHTNLFGNLPSFAPLKKNIESLNLILTEIKDWIARYATEGSEIDFRDFSHELSIFMAEGLEEALDSYPHEGPSKGKISARERALFEEVDVVMERVWEEIKEQGYKLHAAMMFS